MSLQDDSRRKDSAMPMPGAGDIAQGMHADGISGEIADGRKGNHAGHVAGDAGKRPGGDMARYFAREGVDPLTSASRRRRRNAERRQGPRRAGTSA